jgi:hypothetical protein
VQFPENFSLPGGFKLADTGMEYCDVQTATGDYSCLRVSKQTPTEEKQHKVLT